MNKNSMQHLHLHHNTWVIRIQVPVYAQDFYQTKNIIKSTKIKRHEVEDAKLVRDQFVATHKLMFNAIKRGEDLSKFKELEFTADVYSNLIRDEFAINPSSNEGREQLLGLGELKDKFDEGALDEAINLYVTGGWSAINKISKEQNLIDPLEAIERKSETESMKVNHHLATVKGKTFGSLIDQYLQTRNVTMLTSKYQDTMRARLEDFAGKYQYMNSISKALVSDYKEELEQEGLASSTINTRLGILGGYWSYLAEKGLVDEDKANPFQGLTVPKHVVYQREHYTIEELKLLISGRDNILPDEHLVDFMKMLTLTGCREKEMVSIKVGDIVYHQNVRVIDLKEDMTKANSKRGVGSSGVRKIPITNKMEPIIDKLIETKHQRRCPEVNKDKGFIFDTGIDKYGDLTKSLAPRFGRYKSKLGFPKHIKVGHGFRHTANTLLAGEDCGYLNKVYRDTLLGWSADSKSMADSVYLQQDTAYPMHKRKEDLERLGNIFYFI